MKVNLSKIQNKKDRYAEAGQNIPCKFAYCEYDEENVYPLHLPVLCREYLTDILGYNLGVLDKKWTFHGLTFKDKIPMDKICLYMERIGSHFKDHIKKLQEIEKKLGIKETEVTPCGESQVLVVGDKFWLSHTIVNSWYTSFLRACCVENKKFEFVNYPFNARTLVSSLFEPFSEYMAIPFVFKEQKWETPYINPGDLFHHSNGYYYAWKGLAMPSFAKQVKKYVNNN